MVSDAELRQREERYGSILAQREEDESKKREDEERERREEEAERKRREEEERKTREEEERKTREEEERKTREEEERKKREEQQRKKLEEEKRERETHIVAGEAAVAFARKRLGDGDIEEAKAARAKAALEYGQAKEDRTSEIAVRIYVQTFQNPKGRIYIYLHPFILVLTCICRLYCNSPQYRSENVRIVAGVG